MSTTSTVTPPPEISPDALPMPPPQAIDAWDELKRHLSQLLRSTEPDAEWLKALDAAALRLRTLGHRSPDMALYLMLQSASVEVDRYSAQHAMLCALICELCAEALDWPADEVDTLVRAALTMNLSMSATQDALARQSGPLSDLQREEVHTHAARSAALLAAAGVQDRLWLEVTRRHHDDIPVSADDAKGDPWRLAQLLHRVDIYTAKLSCRASREPASPAIAARDACLDANGHPDAIGATMLRTLGLYPPGCFVLLATGETGVVIQRGAKAHTPVVALLRRADGGLYLQPARRDTSLRRHAVVHGVRSGQVKVRLNHERVLGAL